MIPPILEPIIAICIIFGVLAEALALLLWYLNGSSEPKKPAATEDPAWRMVAIELAATCRHNRSLAKHITDSAKKEQT